MDVQSTALAVQLQEQLCRLGDGADGPGTMIVAEKREISHRLQVVEVRAGEREEVAQHRVRVPVGGQFRHAVEDVECAAAGVFDHGVDPGDEGLETLGRVQLVNLDPAVDADERRMAGKAKVDDLSPGLQPGPAEGLDHGQVVADSIHLPNNIVAGQNALEHLVQAGQAGRQCRRVIAHTVPSFLPRKISMPQEPQRKRSSNWRPSSSSRISGSAASEPFRRHRPSSFAGSTSSSSRLGRTGPRLTRPPVRCSPRRDDGRRHEPSR